MKRTRSAFKYFICAITAAVLVMTSFAGCSNKKVLSANDSVTSSKIETTSPYPFGEINFDTEKNEADLGYTGEKGSPLAAFKIKGYGFFVIKLEKELAPYTVDNFVKLAKDGFYDGNYITHSLYGHSIRGGDKTGAGNGGAGYTIKGEPVGEGKRKLAGEAGKSGAVSMFRPDANDYDCASSQFMIMIGNDPSLNGEYCRFGSVIYGMDVLKKINEDGFANTESEEDAKLKENVVIEKVLIDDNA